MTHGDLMELCHDALVGLDQCNADKSALRTWAADDEMKP